MVSQAGAQGGRRLTDAKKPANEEQEDRGPANAVTPKKLEEQSETPRDHMESLSNKPLVASTTTPVGTDSSRAASRSICREPPVTKSTLSELDVPRIVFNPKLRHDINFDPDLHFRPNLDGEKGRRKTKKANEFWECFRAQLDAFMKGPSAFLSELGGQKWCLPLTLYAIGEILVTLVPPEDRGAVQEILNVDLLMQQFSKGVADLEKLATWLSRTLKSHCAPMRDEWVDEMVTQLSAGNAKRDINLLVRGLYTLLGVLEAMKLDVANHQIRCLRPLLIQDTVEFEQTFFVKKIAMGKINVVAAYNFYQAARIQDDSSSESLRSSPREMWPFLKGFANLLLPSNAGMKIPDTFMFDEERIVKMRSDILDAVNLDLCMRLFRDECQRQGESSSPSTPTVLSDSSSYLSGRDSPISRSGSPVLNLQLRDSLSNKFFEERSRSLSPFSDDPICHSDGEDGGLGSRPLFPSSSINIFSFNASPPARISRSAEHLTTAKEDSVRESILALVDDTAGDQRWKQCSSSIALQILRSVHGQDSLSIFESKDFETKLNLHLGSVISPCFRASQSSVYSELLLLLDDLATQYTHKTSTQLFEVASVQRPLPFQSISNRISLRESAKQIAHIGILHWRVWAPLTYLVNPQTEDMATHAANVAVSGSRTIPQNATQPSGAKPADGRMRSPEAQASSYGT